MPSRISIILPDFKALALFTVFVSTESNTGLQEKNLNETNTSSYNKSTCCWKTACVSFPNSTFLLLRKKHGSKGMLFWLFSEAAHQPAFTRLPTLSINLWVVSGPNRTIFTFWEVARAHLSINSLWKEGNSNLISSSPDWTRSAVLQICLAK